MSSLIVEVSRISKVKPHSNAERLELAEIKGWQVVVPKGKYQEGNLVTYFPPDSVLEPELSDRIGITKYLSGGRVRCAKLRGEPSFGVVMDLEDPSWREGQDVAEHYKVKKYVPPVKLTAGDSEAENPLFQRYTSIENMRNFPDVFQDGERVIVTEKLHGTNSRIAVLDGNEVAGSHRMQRKGAQSIYWHPWSLPNVAEMMRVLADEAKQVILYGEIYGKVQSLRYGVEGISFAAFDLMMDGKYLDNDKFREECGTFGVPMVPVLYDGPFSLAKIKELAEGKTTMNGADHIREGVVVRPAIERTDPKIGRCVLKYVGDGYLFGDASDMEDE